MNVMLRVFNYQTANIKGLAESNSAMKFSSESNTIILGAFADHLNQSHFRSAYSNTKLKKKKMEEVHKMMEE